MVVFEQAMGPRVKNTAPGAERGRMVLDAGWRLLAALAPTGREVSAREDAKRVGTKWIG